MHTYIQSELGLWTVGTYASGSWVPESDHADPETAAARVHFLNGGNPGLIPLINNAREVLRTATYTDDPQRQAAARKNLRGALRAAGFEP